MFRITYIGYAGSADRRLQAERVCCYGLYTSCHIISAEPVLNAGSALRATCAVIITRRRAWIINPHNPPGRADTLRS